MQNDVHKVERSAEDAAAVKQSLLESFPFLGQHPFVLYSLARWHEWYVGVLDEDVDPSEYDCFSLSPLEELHWRTEWRAAGFFTIAFFFVNEIETDVVISTSPDSNLYLWKRGDSSRPVVCPVSLEEILDGVEQSPQQIAGFLSHLTERALDAGSEGDL